MQAVSRKNESEDDQCAAYLRAIADSTRLQVIRALQNGPLTVSDIALLLDVEIVRASHHLRVLYHADLVSTERDGKFIYYQLNRQFLKRRSTLDFGCCKVDICEK